MSLCGNCKHPYDLHYEIYQNDDEDNGEWYCLADMCGCDEYSYTGN